MAAEYRPLWQLAAENDAASLQAQLQGHSYGINARDARGWTPLHIAALHDSASAAGALLRFSADVNAKSGHLEPTPLHLAAWHGHVAVAEVLLEHGADPEATNALGEVPLQKAQQRGNRAFAEMLARRAGTPIGPVGHTCQACHSRALRGSLGTGRFEGLWFCDGCWASWRGEAGGSAGAGDGTGGSATTLPVLSRGDFQRRVAEGAKWVIIDGTIVDIEPLTQKGDALHKGGGDVLTRAIGGDLTGYFVYYHANIPRTQSLHKPGISHLEHVREKVVQHAVAVLDTHRHLPPLGSPEHRFWVESDEKEPYHEHSCTSFAALGLQPRAQLESLLAGLGPADVRAFWAVLGCLVADAAAQPTHWNYKPTYFEDALRRRNRWENPEFLRPSLNVYYHVPMGCNSCYGDQALQVLKSIVECGGVDPSALEQRFAQHFSEEGAYGPLPQEGLYNGNKQHVRDLPIKGPWRHISLAGFLKNVQEGHHFPDTGTSDAQADCFVRIVPVVALFAGHVDMLDKVTEVVRLTQDNPPAIAVGQAFARILEGIIIGCDGLQAIQGAADEFDNKKSELNGFCGRVAGTMRNCAAQSGASLYDAVLGFGGGAYSTSQVS